MLPPVPCFILYSFPVHITFSYFAIFLNNCKLRILLRYLIISVITLNVHQLLPFLHISVVFYICTFCIVFKIFNNFWFFIFAYLFVYLLVVLYISKALCMTQRGLLFFQKYIFVQLILFILFLISITLIHTFISVITMFLLSLSLIYLV